MIYLAFETDQYFLWFIAHEGMSLRQRVKHGLLPHVLALERAKQCMQFISSTVEVSGLAATASAGL